jgi:RsiW-degrading membrane proteinase PrsW (M82 family)
MFPIFHLSHRAGPLRILWAATILFVVWLAPLVAFAQEAEEEAEPKAYVLGYALLGFCVGLGIFVVVRPGKRRFPKIKPKSDDEDEKPKGH